MTINSILILGSTYLTELAISKLQDKYNLVGYVPSVAPTNKGNIELPVIDITTKCDITLSIQYDRIVKDTHNCFNVHTGLLPEYGGTNILDYSIHNKAHEQGLTLHKMTERLDHGPIISKITYPVLPTDTAFDLYKRLLTIGPQFILSSLKLLETLSVGQINNCYERIPTIYRRGEFTADSKISEYK